MKTPSLPTALRARVVSYALGAYKFLLKVYNFKEAHSIGN
jgi:hypothetical protein